MSLTATLSVCASCAQMVEVGSTASREGAAAAGAGSGTPDAGTDPSGTGVGTAAGRWVLVAASTGECEFHFVGVNAIVPGAFPDGACDPCPTPTAAIGDYDGTACRLPNYPRCTYVGATTEYLDCTVNANGSLTYAWSTAP